MLARLWTRYGPIGCVVVFALLFGVNRCQARRQGAQDAALHVARDSVTDLRTALVAAQGRFRVDTVTLTAHETRYVTLRDTILTRRTDTLISIDTVRLLVAAADSTIHACRVTVSDCEARADAAEGIIAQQAKQIAALEHRTTHWYSRIGICGGYGLAASPSGQVIHGATLGACVKLWP